MPPHAAREMTGERMSGLSDSGFFRNFANLSLAP
jgi:hypothetical protein